MKLEKTRSILLRRIPNDLVELVFDYVDVFNVDENVQRINATIQVGFRMFTGNIDLSDSLFYVQQSPPSWVSSKLLWSCLMKCLARANFLVQQIFTIYSWL